jgi:hypothetical protein
MPLGPFNNQRAGVPILVGVVVLVCDQETDSYLIAR